MGGEKHSKPNKILWKNETDEDGDNIEGKLFFNLEHEYACMTLFTQYQELVKLPQQ